MRRGGARPVPCRSAARTPNTRLLVGVGVHGCAGMCASSCGSRLAATTGDGEPAESLGPRNTVTETPSAAQSYVLRCEIGVFTHCDLNGSDCGHDRRAVDDQAGVGRHLCVDHQRHAQQHAGGVGGAGSDQAGVIACSGLGFLTSPQPARMRNTLKSRRRFGQRQMTSSGE